MRIFIVTNLYPPHYFGGYEVRCAQVADYLHAAGHEIRVLTSSYKPPTNREFSPESQLIEIREASVTSLNCPDVAGRCYIGIAGCIDGVTRSKRASHGNSSRTNI
jgi:hypothetical protein